VTDVGKVQLGVELDADDLAARLGEAVRRAIAPALAEINRELNKVQREYEKTGRSAEKSGAAQRVAMEAAEQAVHNLGEEQTKAARKTAAAGGISTRSINAVTRALDKQTAAWAANTAARTANAAAPTGGPPTGGTRGPPGGGGSFDRHRGGFMQGGKGRFGFLTSPLGMNAVALGVGSLGPALAVVTDLVGGVQQLAGAGLALPGIYGAAGASILTAVAGFKGMGDAVKALNEAAKSGDPKDLEKATEAMKDMDPAAQAVAKTVSGLTRGPLLDLQKMMAGRMFAGFDTDLQNTADKVIPRLSGRLGDLSTAWNGTLKALTGAARDDRNLSLLDGILGDTATAQTKINERVVAPLTHALLTLTKGGTNVLPRLADGLAAGAERFDKFITHAAETGKLDKWINDGVTGMRQLAESGMNLVKIVMDITHAAGSDQGGFLRWLESATDKLHDITSSASGQSAMRKFFDDAREMGKEWLPILTNIGKALIEVYEASRTWTNILLPFLRVASDLLTAFPGLITAAGVALLAWKTSSIFKPLISGLDTVIGKLGTVAQTADLALGNTQAGRGGISGAMSRTQRGLNKLGGTRGTLGLGGLAAGTAMEATADDTTGQVVGALTTVASGALAGSVFGPVGTAVGAGVGAAIAGVTFLLSENAKEAKAAADAQAAYQASLEQSREALLNLQGAQKEVNDSLLAASGNLADQGVQQGIAANLEALPESLKAHYGDNAAKGFSDSIAKLGLSNAELANQLTASQPIFDALQTNLRMMGPDGAFAADQLRQLRDQIMGASQQAAVAGPAMATLAEILHTDVAGAAATVRTAVQSIPENVPITMDLPNADATVELLRSMGYQIDIVDGRAVVINADDQKVKDADAALEALGVKITHLPTGQIQVEIDQAKLQAAQMDMNNFFVQYSKLLIQPTVQPAPGQMPAPGVVTGPPEIMPGVPFPQPPRATGGVLPGYSPGRDNMLVPLGGGEGIIIPEAMRWLGSDWLYNLNSSFRGGISRQGYAGGGVHMGTGLPPGPLDPDAKNPMLTTLEDILAVLQGRGGPMTPLNMTATQTQKMSDALIGGLPGMTPGRMGPFGTPIKPRNRGYEMASAALQALGADPEKWIGPDPVEYFGNAIKEQLDQTRQAAGSSGGVPGGMPGAPVDYGKVAAALVSFAHTGNLADVAGIGLNANDPVIGAITSARNKKGGLSDDALVELINQIVGGTGYSGVLDTQNTAIVKSLTRFREQMDKKGGVPGAAMAMPGAANTGGYNFDALAKLEAGGNWSINTGNGYFGGLQFDQSTWDAYKPAGFPARADLASREQQIQVAMIAMQARGGPESLWPQNYSALGQPGATNVTGANLPGVTQARASAVKGSKAGLQPAAANLFDVISQYFPQIGEIGGVRQDSLPYHPSGRALDIMIPGAGGLNDPTPPGAKALGDSIYQFLMTNASALGIDTSGTLWQQKDHFNHIHAQLIDGIDQFTNAGLSAAPGGLGGATSGSGTPVFVTNWPGGGGAGMPPGVSALLGGLTQGGQEAAGNVVGDIGAALSGAVNPSEGQPNAALGDLIQQRNPMALAAALGLNVPDFTREGGAGADAITQAGGFDAQGRLFSDTAGLLDRTFTTLATQLQAMRDQIVSVIDQVVDKLNDDALTPVVKAGVQSALEGLKESVSNQIGTAMGNAAAPPIADAVSSAVSSLPIDQSGAGNTGNNAASLGQNALGAIAGGFATGGLVWGGIPGRDTVPLLAQQGEFVLDTGDVARMGGPKGVEAFRRALERGGGIRHFATGGGVNVNDVVGAEFFGVSEVPIISTIVNLLVRVLLKVIGVEIEARDTLAEMTGEFRTFRGDAFKAFDAQGRLLNDTSALIERSSTSEETAAAERIRILKIVIQAIIKYLIEKVIVPIMKAVANSAIQAGASAAGAAVNTQAPGAGGIVSSLISSAGQAGVDIAAEVGTDFALAISQTLIDMVAEGLVSQFPDMMTGIFGGAGLAALFDPLGGGLGNVLGALLGIFTGLVGFGALGGASTMIPGDALLGGTLFDDGGMAEGVGWLPKGTEEPELVLSPTETNIFSRFVAALERGGFGGGGNRTVNAPITVIGGRETAAQVEDRLLRMMP